MKNMNWKWAITAALCLSGCASKSSQAPQTITTSTVVKPAPKPKVVKVETPTPQPPKPWAIVPGSSIGLVKLGASRKSVRQLLGKPSKTYRRKDGLREDTWIDPHSSNDVGYPYRVIVIYKKDKVVQVETSSPKFSTVGGFSTKNNIGQARRLFGHLKTARYGVEAPEGGGYIEYYYDSVERGVAFAFKTQDDGGQDDSDVTIETVFVHPKGQAVVKPYGAELMQPVKPMPGDTFARDDMGQGQEIEVPATTGNLPTGESAGADSAAMQDLQANSWVKDVYVSPGHMNIGVIPGEKDWNAPMIGQYACGVLRKHGSALKWVRFVDIVAVANEGKSPNQAEISKVACP